MINQHKKKLNQFVIIGLSIIIVSFGGGNSPVIAAQSNTNTIIANNSITTILSEPLNIQTIPNNNFVTLSWQAPITGKVDYYQINALSNNHTTSRIVDSFYTEDKLTIIDKDAKNKIRYVYQIIAHDKKGTSSVALSKSVMPRAGYVTIQPSSIITSKKPSAINEFGSQIAFTKDGLTMAIASARGTSGAISDVGVVHLYTKSKIKDKWKQGPAIVSNNPRTKHFFGEKLAFSPDGTTLAITESVPGKPNSFDDGNVQIFLKSQGSWKYAPIPGAILHSEITPYYSSFGWSLAFSPDGSTLAVSEQNATVANIAGLVGKVRLFVKTGLAWTDDAIIEGATLYLQYNQNSTKKFGHSLAFSPDSNTIAISVPEQSSYLNYSWNGTVHLYSKLATDWIDQPTLEVILTGKLNLGKFGSSLDFSPDGTTLAISEVLGNPTKNTIAGSGLVQLYIRTGDKWDTTLKIGPEISSNNPAQYNDFGRNIKFSPDGKKLAVAETSGEPLNGISNSGVIQIFNQTDSIWSNQPTQGSILISDAPSAYNGYGYRMKFNADGSKLYVGEPDVDVSGIQSAGAVKVYETHHFK